MDELDLGQTIRGFASGQTYEPAIGNGPLTISLPRAVVALLVAMGVSVVAAIAFGFIAGHLTLLTATAALICGAGSAIYVLKKVRLSDEPARKPSVLDWFVIVCFGLFALRAFCW